MRSLIGIAAAALLSSGCIIVAEDSIEPGDPLDAQFSLTWSLEDAFTGADLHCLDVGADTVIVTSTNDLAGEVFVDLYDCRAEGGATQFLTAGDYWVDVQLAACGGAPDCDGGFALSETLSVGPYSVYSNRTYDLGHVIFVVD